MLWLPRHGFHAYAGQCAFDGDFAESGRSAGDRASSRRAALSFAESGPNAMTGWPLATWLDVDQTVTGSGCGSHAGHGERDQSAGRRFGGCVPGCVESVDGIAGEAVLGRSSRMAPSETASSTSSRIL